MTIACLGMFQLELSINPYQRLLYDYPLYYLPFHLEGVERTTVPPGKACKIIEGLYWLFRTTKGALTLFSSPSYYDEFHSS